MAYSGKNTFELMVPLRDPTTVPRIEGFYTDIGWKVLSSEGGLMLSAVPDTGERLVEGIGHWQTDRPHRMAWFEDHSDPAEPAVLSEYTRGMRLRGLMDLIERPLELPTDDDLAAVLTRGGDLLKRHTHTFLRRHADRWEIRFADPFLFGIRLVGPETPSH